MERHVYYISDGTGITAENFGKSLLTQFPDIAFLRKTLPFIDSLEKACAVVDEINQKQAETGIKPLVFYTIVDDKIAECIEQSKAYTHPLFESFIKPLEEELKTDSSHQKGRQHAMGEAAQYKKRLDAINFTLRNDDGINIKSFAEADVILLGVSRCGKTPTCLYLAMHFNLKAANYPIIDEEITAGTLPEPLKLWRNKCFGLTINPMQLSQIRQERMPNSTYAELSQCKFEINHVENMYFDQEIPNINTSNISIEEISTQIINQTHLSRET